MPATDIQEAQLILLLLLLFVTIFAALARKLRTPYPIVLVIAGLLLGFVPAIPRITLDPDIIFFVVLPPLLYADAWVTSWRGFFNNLPGIAMLAVGLVAFTAAAVAGAGPWLFSGFDWPVGLVLGAVVSTTDSIAASAIARRVGLPHAIVELLEGESLVNDATGLLALEFATMIVTDGRHPAAGWAILRLIYLIVAAIVTGLVIGRLVEWLGRRLNDGPIEIAISILVPYAAYLTADAIHTSGVLAVVVTGLYLGRKSADLLSPTVRIQRRAVWDSLTFILNGLVFVLIGLQLPAVLAGVSELSTSRAMLYGALFSLLLILLRMIWTYAGTYAAHFVRTRLLHRRHTKRPDVRHTFVVGWTGMRGVVALASAMSLPETIAGRGPFPHRDLIVFLTFIVILVTLVLQGLTLPALVRLLGLSVTGTGIGDREGRRRVLEAMRGRLDEITQSNPSGPSELYEDLARHYEHRLAGLNGSSTAEEVSAIESYSRYLDLSRELLEVERENARRLWDDGLITDSLWREIEHELDLNETRLGVIAGKH